MITHYIANQKQQRRLKQSTGDFSEAAICGNGEPGYRLTHSETPTCEACQQKIEQIGMRTLNAYR